MLEFAGTIATRFSPHELHEAGKTFLVIFDAKGCVSTLTFAEPQSGWHKHLQTLDAKGVPFLFYDPFDAPEYIFLVLPVS